MPTLNVPGNYRNMSAAIAAASPGDKIVIASGYWLPDIVDVTVEDLTFDAPSNAEGITLIVGESVSKVTLLGEAPIKIRSAYSSSNNNMFIGNEGANVITSYRGIDTLEGRGGNDTFRFEGGSPKAGGSIDGGTGDDTVQASDLGGYTFRDVEVLQVGQSIGATVAQLSSFDRIVGETDGKTIVVQLRGDDATFDFTGKVAGTNSVFVYGTGSAAGIHVTGTAYADLLNGTRFDDTLKGGEGNDTIVEDSGGMSEGTDTLDGGAGDDTFRILGVVDRRDMEQQTATFGGTIDGGSGIDTVEAYDLRDFSFRNVEVLKLGTSVAQSVRATIEQICSFRLIVNADQVGSNQAPSISLDGKGGFIDISNRFDVNSGAEIYGSSLTSSFAAIGTANADLFIGSEFGDTLDGRGGADKLDGGRGNDTYVTDGLDTIKEYGGGGIDTACSSASLTLANNLENLWLTGSGRINGTGTSSANAITGNGASNRLDGMGGADTLNGAGGTDTLIGGAGNDVYVTDGRDTITEAAGGGIDTVRSTVSLTLAANLETLVLDGRSNVDGTGNSLANTIVGNGGANVLDGRGGNDVLQGGKGDDTFVFSVKPGADNVDRIVGFVTGHDEIALSKLLFKGLGSGYLDDNLFKDVASGRVDEDDRILYNHRTGKLSFDVDGSGKAKAVLFAVLDQHPTLEAHDILVL